MKTLPNLNPLRFLLAFLVILFHVPQFFSNRGLPYFNDLPVFNKGTEAVYVFFALSGFLIVRLLYNEKIESENINVQHFYMRRILRIFPLYIVVLSLGLFYYNVFLDYVGFDIDQTYNIIEVLVLYTFFLPNVGAILHEPGGALEILWSIGIEEQFYIMVAPAIFLLHKNYILPFFVMFTCVYFFLFSSEYFSFLAKFNFLYFYLSAGGVVSLLDIKYQLGDKLKKYHKVIAIVLFVLYFNVDFQHLSRTTTHLMGLILFPITILSLSVSPLFTIKSKFMNHLGKISYGIYMYHAFAIQMVGFLILKLNSIQILPSSVLIFLSFFLVTTITILIAHISYVFFEKKLISLKKRYR